MNKATLEKILMPLKTFWEGMDKTKKIRLAIAAVLVILITTVSIAVVNHTEYTTLYSNLEPSEAGRIMSKLEEMKIDAKAQGQGTILVPKGNVEKLRMELSAEGYPKNGLNYDIFQNSTGFGTTEFEKQKYLQFQLQERLQYSIKTLEVVEDCIVTLNIPDNSSFVLKEDKRKVTASVILKLKNTDGLTKEQVKGIEGLVAKSVEGLAEDDVLIIDSLGNNLKPHKDEAAGLAGEQLELESSMGQKLQRQVLSLLEPVFGVGRVTAGVRVSLDFDKQVTESVRFSPAGGGDEGIPISTNISSEEATSMEQGGTAGQDANGGAPQYVESDANGGLYKKTNKTINYEVDKIKDTVQKAEGKIKDISVSVLLDENNLPSGSDEKVKDIVAGALGISRENVAVQSMPFNGAAEIGKIFDSVQQANDRAKKQALLRNSLMFAVLGLILLAILKFVIMPYFRRKTEEGVDSVMQEGIINTEASQTSENDNFEFNINKSEKRQFIEKSIEKNPEFVARLLRNWLNEGMR